MECQAQHSLCKLGTNASTPLPTHVLDVHPLNGVPDVRLLETNGELDKYVCLSHSWIEGHTITTTSSNIERRTESVPWNDLPGTFQDAVTFARHLGLRYIWINSLCIIQSLDSGDWSKEAPKIGQYYRNACITVSAASAITVQDGCFKETPKGETVKIRPNTSGVFPEYVAHFRRPLPHGGSPLHHRGWVFQEHLLSTRIVHFGEEVVWECAQVTKCGAAVSH